MPEQKRPAPSTSLPKICRTVGECFAGVLIPLTPIFASVLPILLAVYLGYRMLHSGFDDTVAGALLASEYVANKLVIPTWLASIAFLVSLGQNSAAYTCNWTGLMCGDVGRDKILDKNDSNAFKTMKDQRFALVNALATLPANVEHTFVPHDLFDRLEDLARTRLDRSRDGALRFRDGIAELKPLSAAVTRCQLEINGRAVSAIRRKETRFLKYLAEDWTAFGTRCKAIEARITVCSERVETLVKSVDELYNIFSAHTRSISTVNKLRSYVPLDGGDGNAEWTGFLLAGSKKLRQLQGSLQTRQKLLVAFKKQLKAFGDEIGTIRDLRATSTNARVAEGAIFNEELGRILAAGGIRG